MKTTTAFTYTVHFQTEEMNYVQPHNLLKVTCWCLCWVGRTLLDDDTGNKNTKICPSSVFICARQDPPAAMSFLQMKRQIKINKTADSHPLHLHTYTPHTVDNSIMLTFRFYETILEWNYSFRCTDCRTEEK